MSRNTHHRTRDHFGTDSDTSIVTTSGVGSFPADSDLHDVLTNMAVAGLSITLEGFAQPVLAGNRGFVEFPFNATITSAKIFVDQATNATVDLWKTTYANYPPDSGDTICGGNKLTLSNAAIATSDLAGWTTTITSGDILWVHVDSNSWATAMTIALTLARRP